MSDFCSQCFKDMGGLGIDLTRTDGAQTDLAGLCKEDEETGVLCEGCGFIAIDSEGQCMSKNCLIDHETGTKRVQV